MTPPQSATVATSPVNNRLTRLTSQLLRLAYRLGCLALIAYIAVLAWLYFQQEHLLFYPEPLDADYQFTLAGVTEEHVAVEGATLSALHFRQPNTKGVVFFLHGNSGNLQNWLTDTAFYRRTGYDLFMIDFRGFGKSTGKIESEAQLHADVLTAWRQIEKEYAGRKNVIYGRSLGTGLAAHLTTMLQNDAVNKPALLVLVSPYLSLQQMAKDQYPWVPSFVMRYPMRTDLALPSVRTPTLILHGAQDALIPVSHGQRLKALQPKAEFVVVPEAGHDDIHEYPAYRETLAQRLLAL